MKALALLYVSGISAAGSTGLRSANGALQPQPRPSAWVSKPQNIPSPEWAIQNLRQRFPACGSKWLTAFFQPLPTVKPGFPKSRLQLRLLSQCCALQRQRRASTPAQAIGLGIQATNHFQP